MIGIIRRLFELLDAQTRRGVAVLLASSLAVALLEMIGIGLMLPMLQLLLMPEKLVKLPLIGPHAAGLVAGDNRVLVWAALGLFGFYLGKNTLLALLMWYQKKFVYDAEHRFCTTLYRNYLQHPYVNTLGENSAEVARTLTRSAPAVFGRVLLPLIDLSTEALLSLAALAMLLLVDPLATFAAAGVMGVLLVGFYRSFRRQLTDLGHAQEHSVSEMLKWANQGVGAAKEIRTLGSERFFVAAFSSAVAVWARCSRHSMMLVQIPRLVGELVVVGGLMLVLAAVLARREGLAEALPVLGVFGAAALRLLPSMNRMMQSLSAIRETGAAVEHVHHAARLVGQPAVQAVDGPAIHFSRSFALEGVTFTYPGAARPALDQVNLSIRHGEAVAIVGVSGSGKTTLGDVVLGLLTPDKGRILIDGAPAAAGWRHLIGFVPQAVYLTDDTIRRNIAFGIPDDRIDEIRLARAVEAARLSEVVLAQPKGLDSEIGERGARLSGGQRQRIGIARALYHDPDILVLDEATSALDNETERDVTAAIERLRGQKTMVVIAHRLSTVRRCDRFVVMEEGRVAAVGGFDEVLRASPAFARMVSLSEIKEAEA